MLAGQLRFAFLVSVLHMLLCPSGYRIYLLNSSEIKLTIRFSCDYA